MKHRATGRPRGRPTTIPFDIDDKVLDALARRVDPKTNRAKPDWVGIARELGISRTSVSRVMARLKRVGFITTVYEDDPRNRRVRHSYYILHKHPVLPTETGKNLQKPKQDHPAG